MNKFAILLAVGLVASASALAAGAPNLPGRGYCGELRNHYGPLDYRKRGEVNLEIVEYAHFTPEVEAGIKGNTDYIGGDLDYTLRAIPNHPRALNTLATLAARAKVVFFPHTKWPVECYFDRARRFAPDDPAPVVVHGNYLFMLGKLDQALEVFKQAHDLAPEDPTIHYNLGLLYMKKKDSERALEHAQKAYAKNFPLPGLKKQLKEAGKWIEPPQANEAAPETATPEQAKPQQAKPDQAQ
jgi:tetratricopeptide (TPR) repeat protein